MKTETISFEIPQDLLASLKLGAASLGQSIRVDLEGISRLQSGPT